MKQNIVFNAAQLDWVSKVLHAMVEFTLSYNQFQKPLSDQEWQRIVDQFHMYVNCSKNNSFIIDISITFLSYLEENDLDVRRMKESIHALSEEQFEFVNQYVDDVIADIRTYQTTRMQTAYETVRRTIERYQELTDHHALFEMLSKNFEAYLNFTCSRLTNQMQRVELAR